MVVVGGEGVQPARRPKTLLPIDGHGAGVRHDGRGVRGPRPDRLVLRLAQRGLEPLLVLQKEAPRPEPMRRLPRFPSTGLV